MTEDKKSYSKANCKNDRALTKTVGVVINLPKTFLINSPPLLIDSLTSHLAFKAFHNLVPIFCVIPMCSCANSEFQQFAISPPIYKTFCLYTIPST